MEVVCPLCKNAVPAHELSTAREIVCGSCGSAFTLAGEQTRTFSPRAGLPTLGHFELLGVVGEGAFGTVYQARDTRLGRTVAIKVPRVGSLPGVEDRDRFFREARSAAQLRHPSIVTVHDVGEHDGVPYLVSDFVRGLTLADVLTGRRFTPAEAAVLVSEVADALHYAHENGVVHRDVKPSNVMIGEDGTPHVMDFGLAKRDAGEVTVTVEGQVLGTPAYMSPEQARGESHKVDRRGDIYSLGVVLYQLLAGRLPFVGNARMILHQVLNDEPRTLRSFAAHVPRDLETIAMKAMAKEPGRRYDSAREMADDLRRFLAGESIRARPAGAVTRGVKWVRRRPSLAALISVTVTAVFVLVAGGVWAREAMLNRQAADQVHALETADVASVPKVIGLLNRDRRRALPLLVGRANELPADSPQRLHVALALLPEGGRWAGEVEPWLFRAGPDQLAVVVDALRASGRAPTARLRETLEDPRAPRDRRFRAACALAALDPRGPQWVRHGGDVAAWLIASDRPSLLAWAALLKPVRGELLDPLRSTWLGDGPGDDRDAAARVLADYVDEPGALVALVAEGSAGHSGPLMARLPSFGDAAASRLEGELARALAATGGDPESLTKRRGNLAAALLAAGRGGRVWPLLRHGEDDRLRTYLIHLMPAAGVDPGALTRRFEDETDVSVRRALLLSLGEYSDAAVPLSTRSGLIPRLEEVFRTDPDAGLHSAAEWVLRRWGRSESVREIEAALASAPGPAGSQWSVNAWGHTMAVVRGPVEFLMGSPGGEPARGPDEARHRVRIGRSFAIATKETTLEQVARAGVQTPRDAPNRADEGQPVGNVMAGAACMYCRALSEKENLPEGQMCYPPQDIFFRDGMKPYPDYLSRGGYRLPTEAEYEYACRAGATTARPFGETEAFLPRYAWFGQHLGKNSPSPVGLLKPNDLGLFDALGNLDEWCSDTYRDYERRPEPEAVDDRGVVLGLVGEMRVLRGGAFFQTPAHLRAAHRGKNPPTVPLFYTGFRVARTVPPGPTDPGPGSR